MRIAVILMMLLLPTTVAQAQNTLERNVPVQGSLSVDGSESWTFTGYEGEALSLVVESADDLDPLLTISSGSGTEILSNDDYNYPDSRDSLLEAITIARTGTYTATITAVSGTSGDYTLTLLPGFADVLTTDDFTDQRTWQSTGAPLNFQVRNDNATLSLDTPQERGMALRTDDLPADMYAEVRITSVTGEPDWTAGLITRYQNSSTYYAFMVNERGQWRFTAGETVLRDWVSHPAIVPGDTAFTLGQMSSGSGFDFFYDGVLIGRVTDSSISDDGQVGIMIETGSALNSSVSASFDDLLITVPHQVNDARVIPDKIIVADSRSIVPQLQRRHLVPGDGQMILTVPESFATYNRPGVYEVPLAEGQTFRNFAIGTTISWTADSTATVGCGLLLRATGETDYTLAYVDQSGGYGLSQRSGDTFAPGIYGEHTPNPEEQHHLLVIANENTLIYYVDGLFAGQLDNEAVDGGVGNAVINFDPVSTSCTFTDTWVWRWE